MIFDDSIYRTRQAAGRKIIKIFKTIEERYGLSFPSVGGRKKVVVTEPKVLAGFLKGDEGRFREHGQSS